VSELVKPLSCVVYRTKCEKLAQAMYRFDQEAAKVGLKYFVAGGTGNRYWGYNIKLVVSTNMEQVTQTIVRRLNP
jgi:hypothetical protein